MPSKVVYPQGGLEVNINIPDGDSITVYTRDVAKVYRVINATNRPANKSLIGTVINGETVFGPYADGATIQINAGADQVLYQIGTEPVISELKGHRVQETPAALNASGTLNATSILNGIVTSSTAAVVTGTLDTGTEIEKISDISVDDSFEWSVINTGATNAFTVGASSGHTVVGNAAVAASSSGRFKTRKTGINTYVTYRIS